MNWIWFAALLAIICSITIIAYLKSLDGPFVLDDVPNLESLKIIADTPGPEGLINFVENHAAGPLGRPISRLTFALNAQNWPADPKPFKLTNLVIHFLVGIAFFQLFILILDALDITDGKIAIALVGTGIWMLHPLNVSTVAYIVQRMAQLSALFSILSASLYLLARKSKGNKNLPIITLYTLSAMFMLLSIFSKENGAVTPFIILTLELTILRNSPKDCLRKAGFASLSLIPIVLILLGSIIIWDGLMESYQEKPFSLEERAWTQPGVLLSYLGQIFTPDVTTMGVFHDDYPLSKPPHWPEAAYPIALLLLLLISALVARKRLPLYSLAVLFFFVGHSIESTILPLEPYFEHRNYLPMGMAMLGFAYFFHELAKKISRNNRILFFLFSTLLLTSLGTLTTRAAEPWKSQLDFIDHASRGHPDSPRSMKMVSKLLMLVGNYQAASKIYQDALKKYPESALFQLELSLTQCRQWDNYPEKFEAFLRNISKSRDKNILGPISKELNLYNEAGACPLISRQVQEIYGLMRDTENLHWRPFELRSIHAMYGAMYLRSGDSVAGIQAYEEALKHTPDDEVILFALAEVHAQLEHLDKAGKYARAAIVGHLKHGYRSRLSRTQITMLEALSKHPEGGDAYKQLGY